MKDLAEDRLLQPHELARVLNVSISWVRNHAAPSCKARIPTKKVGGLLRFDLTEVMEWLAQKEGKRGKHAGQSPCECGR